MAHLLVFFILIPAFALLINLGISRKNEKQLSLVSFAAMGVQLAGALSFTVYWLYMGAPVLYAKDFTIYESHEFELFLDFCFDEVTATFLLVGAFITFLITAYSRNYLHREPGYKRFFNTILLFYAGFNLIVISGNMATLFVGWEVAGLSSFLLIAFYRNRYLPVRNAVKVFSIYRIGDLALILAMWISHHLWHENIVLLKFHEYSTVSETAGGFSFAALAFCLLIFLAASIKSAQVPFSSWLPRALEGPTPSSAIFYSSLAVHLGVLILLRTHHFWGNMPIMQYSVIFIGLITFALASMSARVQHSIKGQIAYSGIAQIGLMFVEVGIGWDSLVLVHFAGNAFLRSYQLLVSPSAVTYLIREQFYGFVPSHNKPIKTGFMAKVSNTLYLLSLKEWHLDSIMHHSIWGLFKRIGLRLMFLDTRASAFTAGIGLLIAAIMLLFKSSLPEAFAYYLPALIAFVGLAMSLRSFVEKKSIRLAWALVGVSHFFTALAVAHNGDANYIHFLFYLSGVAASALVGLGCIFHIEKKEKHVDLSDYQGHCYEHHRSEMVFLFACLGMFGFPITTAFLGLELIFGSIGLHQYVLMALVAVGTIVNSLSVIRMYARIFLGPHIKTYHEAARKSS